MMRGRKGLDERRVGKNFIVTELGFAMTKLYYLTKTPLVNLKVEKAHPTASLATHEK